MNTNTNYSGIHKVMTISTTYTSWDIQVSLSQLSVLALSFQEEGLFSTQNWCLEIKPLLSVSHIKMHTIPVCQLKQEEDETVVHSYFRLNQQVIQTIES